MAVPLIDLRAQFEGLREETWTALRRVFDSQRFVLGAEVEALERGVARLSGAAHAIGCASGSDAIMLAIAALLPLRRATPREGARDAAEVVTTPFTFFASAGSVVHAGARPRFVDIEPAGYGMDPAAVAGAIGPRTLAVLPVHLFGQMSDLDAIVAAAGAVPVVEDAAQSIGAADERLARRRGAGSIGVMGCLSFFPTKNLGGAGDGGMIVTSDDALAQRLRKIRVHGGQQMYHHESVGWNSRLDEVQAAVLNVKLPHLEGWSRTRDARARRYDAMIADAGLASRGLVFPPVRLAGRTHIFHQYVVRVAQGGARPEAAAPDKAGGAGGAGGRTTRDALRDHLASAGIATGVYYPVPLHLQECFRDLGHARGDFPVSERAAAEVLALPIFPEITEDQQAEVVRAMASWFGLA
jgi:dTDP-4-amino-4,6-dideoxygalactose transaminase